MGTKGVGHEVARVVVLVSKGSCEGILTKTTSLAKSGEQSCLKMHYSNYSHGNALNIVRRIIYIDTPLACIQINLFTNCMHIGAGRVDHVHY